MKNEVRNKDVRLLGRTVKPAYDCKGCGRIRVLYSGYCRECAEDYMLSKDYRDTKEFKDYAAAVEYVILHAKRPPSTRELHKALGDHARPEWTLDVIDSLTSVRTIEGFPVDRFVAAEGQTPIYSKRWNGDSMSFLFNRSAKRDFVDYMGLADTVAR